LLDRITHKTARSRNPGWTLSPAFLLCCHRTTHAQGVEESIGWTGLLRLAMRANERERAGCHQCRDPNKQRHRDATPGRRRGRRRRRRRRGRWSRRRRRWSRRRSRSRLPDAEVESALGRVAIDRIDRGVADHVGTGGRARQRDHEVCAVDACQPTDNCTAWSDDRAGAASVERSVERHPYFIGRSREHRPRHGSLRTNWRWAKPHAHQPPTPLRRAQSQRARLGRERAPSGSRPGKSRGEPTGTPVLWPYGTGPVSPHRELTELLCQCLYNQVPDLQPTVGKRNRFDASPRDALLTHLPSRPARANNFAVV